MWGTRPQYSWITRIPGPGSPAGMARYPGAVPPLLANSTISPMAATLTLPEESVGAAELAMIPADDALDLDHDAEPLARLGLDEGEALVGDGSGVALGHGGADGNDLVLVLDDATGAEQLGAAQLVVGLAVLHQGRDLR